MLHQTEFNLGSYSVNRFNDWKDMMYDSKMALAVKSTGRVLRESRDGENTTVYLPFNCEYSLMLKNLNSVKALVKVWIDGTDVTEGTSGLIVEPNTSIDLERFIKNGNLHAGNRFKFIERTSAVSNHRGNKIDDGLIRVEFEFERRAAPILRSHRTSYDRVDTFSKSAFGARSRSRSLGEITCSASGSASSYSSNANFGDAVGANAFTSQGERSRGISPPVETDVGVTVPGAISEQEFQVGDWFPTDGIKHVMVMQMLGEIQGQQVAKPLTVAHKPTCTSCGKVNQPTAKFCSECATGLQLVETV